MRKTILLFLGLIFSLCSQAETIVLWDVGAGKLEEVLISKGYALNEVVDLQIRSTIDARDFVTMNRKLTKLESLDIRFATIVEYTGTDGPWPMPLPETYPAGEVPKLAFGPNAMMGQTVGKTTLKSVQLGQASIGMMAFQACENLETVVFNTSVKEIGQSAFSKCTSLTNIALPTSITTIQMNAFAQSNNLETFVFESPASITKLESGNYSSPKLSSFTIPASVTEVAAGEQGAFSAFKGTLQVEEGSQYFAVEGGILYDKYLTKLIQCPPGVTAVTIPESVLSIQPYAFKGVSVAAPLTIPKKVQEIGRNAFDANAFTAINIDPLSDLKTIRTNAFRGCNAVTSITLPVGIQTIEGYAFQIAGLTDIYIYNPSPSSMTVNANAFYNVDKTTCNLHVLTESLTAYQADPVWSGFTNITGMSLGDADAVIMTEVGKLKETLLALGKNLAEVTDLKIVGVIDQRDFRMMKNEMPVLANIDLSMAIVMQYTDENSNVYPANTIPQDAFGTIMPMDQGKASIKSVIIGQETIGNAAFAQCANLESVTFTNGVKVINNTAFAACPKIKNVSIPSSVHTIGQAAFGNLRRVMSNLETLIFETPASLRKIESGLFVSTKLTSITIPSSVTEIADNALVPVYAAIEVEAGNPNYSALGGILYNKDRTTLIQVPVKTESKELAPGLKTIGYRAFYNTEDFNVVNIPSSVDSIGANAFEGAAVTQLNIPVQSSLRVIGTDAFKGLVGVTEVNIPATVTKIGDGAFGNLMALENIYVYSLVPVDIAENVFSGVDKDECVLHVPAGSLAVYKAHAVWGTFTTIEGIEGLEGNVVVVPEAGKLEETLITLGLNQADITDLTVMGAIDQRDFQFMKLQMPKLARLDLSYAAVMKFKNPWGLVYPANTIPDNAFGSMIPMDPVKTSLVTVIIGQETVGADSFARCTNLANVSFTNNVKEISNNAFVQCNKLTQITIPSSVHTIRTGAFNRCDNIESFVFESPASLKVLEYGVVGSKKLKNLTIPASVTDIVADEWNSALVPVYAAIEVEEGNPNYAAAGGVLYNKDKTTLIQVPIPTTSVTLPETLQIIGLKALYNTEGLTTIDIPASVDSIGANAFGSGAFTKINIKPSGKLRVIANDAFNNCAALEEIILPATVSFIGDNAFYDCISLGNIYAYNFTPVDIAANVFTSVDKESCVLHVPEDAVDAYKSHPVWGTFTTIEGMSGNLGNNVFLLTELVGGTVERISPNGKYVVGANMYGAYQWNVDLSTPDNYVISYLPEKAELYDVINDGTGVGGFENSEFNTITAGIYRNGAWESLGIGVAGGGVLGTMPTIAYGVTADGKTIVGRSITQESQFDYVPYSWTENNTGGWDETQWSFPIENSQKVGVVRSISADGNIAVGYYTHSSGNKRPLIWTDPADPTKYKEFEKTGEAFKVSRNGKYVAMSYDGWATIYDVEKDEMIQIVKAQGLNSPTAQCLDVSDDGIAVGLYSLESGIRKGFVYAEKFGGFNNFGNFLKKYANNIEIPSEVDFSEEAISMDHVKTVTSNGGIITISGVWLADYFSSRHYVLRLADPTVPYNMPQNFNAEVVFIERNQVKVTWEAPEEDNKGELTGYNIYRNSEKVGSAGADALSYIDKDLLPGRNTYSMTAVYDGNIESVRTDFLEVEILPSYDIPFADDFERSSITTNKDWTIDIGHGAVWIIDETGPSGFLGSKAVAVIATGDETNYSLSLTSRPFDARELENVYFSYVHRTAIGTDATPPDKIYVEVLLNGGQDGAVWQTIEEHIMNIANFEYKLYEFDLSDDVAGNVFQIRFRAEGNNQALYYALIDNVQVRTTTGTALAPKNVDAFWTNDNKEEVQIIWEDPSGVAGLSYIGGTDVYNIGNAGKNIIAVNKYDIGDLNPYKGKKLTSLTTKIFINPTAQPSDYQFNLVVFEGEEKIRSQEVDNNQIVNYSFVTFNFDEPVVIKGDKPLYVGIEVVKHPNLKPLYVTNPTKYSDGKGNLFSTDGGETWEKLSDNITDEGTKYYCWTMIANVRDTEVSDDDRMLNVLGYEIFRGEDKINDGILYPGYVFYDENPGTGSPCYTLRAYYSYEAWSAVSNQACATTVSIEDVDVNGTISVTPNPITDGFRVNGIEGTALVKVFDFSGREVISKAVAAGEYIYAGHLAQGIYLIRVSTENGNYEVKVVKK